MSLVEKYCRTDFGSYKEFYNNFKIDVPENFNFGFDIVDETARLTPDKTALVWCDDTEEHDKIFTFSDISKLSNKAANFFKAQGVKKGDPVMLILKRNYQFWYIMPALHKIGAIAIPATYLLTKKDIVYRDNAASVKAIVATNDENVLAHVEASVDDSPTLEKLIMTNGRREGWISFDEEIEKYPDTFKRPEGEEATSNDDIMLMYFTSGTTGNPKMAAHCFTYPLGHIITARFWHDLRDTDLHISVADTGWAKCAWGKLYGQWICGAALFVYDMEKFVPIKLLEKISKHKVTSFCAPPTIYRFMMQENITKFDLSSLRSCCLAGEPLSPDIYNKFKEITGISMREGFGQSETVVALANFPWMTPKPGSMGKPSPGLGVDIIKENGESCVAGEEGEIVFRAESGQYPGLFVKYYRDEQRTKEKWYGGIYHTGDIAWIDEDGYVFYIGRSDDVIKSSGYRIGPFEIESALLEHPSVLETAITAVPDPIRGQVVKATIVLRKGYKPSEQLKKDLQNHVKRITAPYKYPRIVEFVDELPKTTSGKIRRVAIREKDNNK